MEFLEIIKRLFTCLNQNVLIFVVFYVGMVYADQHNIDFLYNICQFVFILSLVSVSVSLIVYTIEYGSKKWYKAKEHEFDYKNKVNQNK